MHAHCKESNNSRSYKRESNNEPRNSLPIPGPEIALIHVEWGRPHADHQKTDHLAQWVNGQGQGEEGFSLNLAEEVE